MTKETISIEQHNARIADLLEANNVYLEKYRELKRLPKLKFERQKMIYRSDLQSNLDKIFIFGDNDTRRGMGGQAAEMRGEPNAHGIATKYSLVDFFDDKDPIHWQIMLRDIFSLERRILLERPAAIVIPQDGLGTGLAEMPSRAPRMFFALNRELMRLEENYGV